MADTIPFPSPQLAAAGFVLQPLAAADYADADAAREHPETAEWVNALSQPVGESIA